MRIAKDKGAPWGLKSPADLESYGLCTVIPTKHDDKQVKRVHLAHPTTPQLQCLNLPNLILVRHSSNADHETSEYILCEIYIREDSPPHW
jgi:hypothetical protein